MSKKKDFFNSVVEAQKAVSIIERSIFDQYHESWVIDFDQGFRYHIVDMSNPREPVDFGWWHSAGAAVQKILMQLPDLKLDTSPAMRYNYTVG